MRYYILVFYLLYFFWDRLFEGLLNLSMAGVFRPIIIMSLWGYTLLNLQHLKSTVGCYNKLKKWFYFASILALVLIIRSLFLGVPIGAIVYTYLQHFGFAPIVLHILSFAHRPIYVKKILVVLMVSTIFLSIGVIADAFIGIHNIINVQGIEHLTRLGIQGVKRGDFTIGSTNVFVFLSVGMMAVYLLVTKFRYKLLNSFFALSIITVAMYASHSRTSSILGMLFLIIITMVLLKFKRYFLKIGFIIIVTFSLFTTLIQLNILTFNIENLTRYDNILSEDTEGNLGRFNAWGRGVVVMQDLSNLPGNGIGATNSQTAVLFGNKLSEHGFESSLFARYYEGGVFGLILFLLPLFLCVKVYKTRRLDVVVVIWMLLLYINFSIAPAAQGYPSNLIIFIAVSFSLLFSTYCYKKPKNAYQEESIKFNQKNTRLS